jgi:hypothetical protein
MTNETPLSQTLLGSFVSSYFRSRRLEDRIRELSALALAATDSTHLNKILEQLSTALHHQVERLRKQASDHTLHPERRQSRLT